MRYHELKTWPEPFEAMRRGDKRFEFRSDDRGFERGDCLWLREVESPEAADTYTGRELWFRVTYALKGPSFGLPEGFACMSVTTTDDRDPNRCRGSGIRKGNRYSAGDHCFGCQDCR